MIYPYGIALLSALLHAVIEKINQWKFDLNVEHNSTLTEIWKKSTKTSYNACHKLVRKIALQLTAD